MEDTTISKILTDLESLNPQSTISRSTLLDLQSLLNLQIRSHNFDDNDSDDTPQINPLWDQLSTRRLSPYSLINPISSAMESTTSSLSLLASAVYLSLFLSPNAPVFSLFTPVSFMSLLHSIRRALKYRKEGSSPSAASDEQRRKKGRGKRAKALNSNLNDGDDNEFDVKLLLGILDKLGLVLGMVHLGRFPDSLKSLVQTVVEIPVLGLDLCANNSGNCKKLLDFCSGILREILKPEHGEQETTGAEVLKSLTPLILATKSQARTFALCFVRIEMMGMAKHSSSLNKAVGNLPRYLAQKAPEKSDIGYC